MSNTVSNTLGTSNPDPAKLTAEAVIAQLRAAKDPARAVLVPHVEEIKRLKAASRRKKTTQAPQTPAPAHDTSTAPKA